MERGGGHGLPKVSPGPAMPDPSTPFGWAIPETTLQPFLECPAHRAGEQLAAVFYSFRHPAPYAHAFLVGLSSRVCAVTGTGR
jgi:hypothetical protein